ncbi:MAG: endonuclease III [Nitrospirae bacterium]|nr:endonuclease III [Nitrospirota bacterium]MBI5696483.1 endonuclease III [Nitrospirota bacterium]
MTDESLDHRKTRALRIVKHLKEKYPADPKTALDYETALDLLVATMLSAQCTDARVNIVTKELLKKYRTAEDYAKEDIAAFEEHIKSTGFYHNKAKNIIAMAQALLKDHEGEVPGTMEELVNLPGVGRKTANLILGMIYGVPGIVCDTHVIRVSQRLGLTAHKDPEKIEYDLYEVIPQEEWTGFSNRLIMHGRDTCHAKKPDCAGCIVNYVCPSAFKV